MFGQENEEIKDYYASIEERVNNTFHNLTTDTLEEIKTRLRRKQDPESQ